MSCTKLKTLQVTANDIKDSIKSIKESLVTANVELSKKKKELDRVNHEIEILTRELTVSEHAILRYIERVYELDIEKIQKEILESPSLATIDVLGSGRYPLQCGAKAVIKDRVIVTIV